MKKHERVCASIDLDALKQNIDTLHELAPKSRIIAVLKGNGYGHGAVMLGRELEHAECVWGYAVATADEAFALRGDGLTKPILVLGYTFPEDRKDIIALDIRPTIFCYEDAKDYAELAKALGKSVSIHIKLDTGLNRLGIRYGSDYVSEICKIAALPGIITEGLYSHFSAADEADKTETANQLGRFNEAADRLKEAGVTFKYRHICDSAATIEYPDAHLDLVRVGDAMYGMWPSDEMDRTRAYLAPVMSLVSHIVLIKTVEAGEYIGYGATFVPDRQVRIATVPVGYADGYDRSLGNRWYVLVEGKKAPIRGRISMDQMMIDVTDIPEAVRGSRVVLVGTDGDETIRVEDIEALPARNHTEFVANINERVPRQYYKSGRLVEK